MKPIVSGMSLAALLCTASTLSAAPVTLQVCAGTSCWNGNYVIEDGVVVTWNNVETMDNQNGRSVNDWETTRGMDLNGWNLSMDSDPFITNNFSLTNTSASTQTFAISTLLGITPAIPNGVMRGSIGMSLTDNNNNGATLAASGASIYRGQIDGSTARTLWDVPTSFTTPFGSTSANTFFGFPVAEAAPQSIDTDIGLIIRFSLSAGDSVSFTSNFEVTPIPVPAALWLLSGGLLSLFGVAHRRG